MNVLLINPPYQTITSNLGVGHQVPLGLLSVGGPLIDAGHRVRLLDAECDHLGRRDVLRAVREFEADVVMTGHAGSTPAHPTCLKVLRWIKVAFPRVLTVYGGVYPTYHAAEIVENEPSVDVVIRGEGETAAVDVVSRISPDASRSTNLRRLRDVPGLAFRSHGVTTVTPERPPAENLDAFRVGWELIENWDTYTCFGMGRAAILQFSRGCPHRCTYCGQHGFWVRWRHRDPVRFADEVERLYRDHDVRFITVADENPTTRQDVWRHLLDELARRRLPVRFFATIRATDIVRDAGLLPLYRAAGILYVLMGIESTRDDVLKQVRKGSTSRHDVEACRLLKQHRIFSILGHIVGLGDETWRTFRDARRALARYDGDYLNAMYVTPHDWTPFGRAAGARRPLVETDQAKWDYRHQVLAEERMRPWQLFFAVKWLELWFHLRPGKVWPVLTERDASRRRQLLWCARHTGLVWFAEVVEFIVRGLLGKRRSPRAAPKPARPAIRPESRAVPGRGRPLPVLAPVGAG